MQTAIFAGCTIGLDTGKAQRGRNEQIKEREREQNRRKDMRKTREKMRRDEKR